MTHRLGTDLFDVLAGVAVVEGTIGTSSDSGLTFSTIPDAKGPISVLIIHGKNDATIPYDGGQGANPAVWVKSVADASAFWTQTDGCSGAAQTLTSTDGNIITADYPDCTVGSEVEVLTIVSGAHQWPSLENQAHFAGSDAIWEFFARHSK